MFTGASSDIPEKCQIEFKSTPRKSARKPQKNKMLWAGSRHSVGQMRLKIRVLGPDLAKPLVRQVLAVLQDVQPRHQPRRQGRASRSIRINRPELPFESTRGWLMSMI